MMKKRVLAIVLILCMLFSLIGPVYAESQYYEISWIKCHGSAAMENAADIQETPDGDFVVTGYVSVQYGLNADLWVGKFTADGEPIWSKTFGGSANDRGVAIRPVADGYLVVGYTESSELINDNYHGGGDFWVIKLDINGDKVWGKCLGGSFNDQPAAVQLIAGDGLVIAGSTRSIDGDVTDQLYNDANFWVVQIDAIGTIAWAKSFGGNAEDRALSITKGSVSGYMVAGSTRSIDGDVTGRTSIYNMDSWLVKLDDNGNKEWDKFLPGGAEEQTSNIERTLDGGYVSIRYATGSNWIEKYDPFINLVWSRNFSNYSLGLNSDIIQLDNGNFIAVASAQVMHLDSSGNILQNLPFNVYSYNTSVNSLAPSAAGGAIMAGVTQGNNLPDYHGGDDIALVRFGIPDNIIFASPDMRQSLLGNGFDINQDSEISKNEALRIRQLVVSIQAANGLGGLEYALNLESLYIYDFAGYDLAPISGLNHLRVLSLNQCGYLASVQALAGLTALEMLDIRACPSLSDYSALVSLQNLGTLNISNCWQLADLSFMSGMNQLQSATLDYNSIRDLSGLQSLANLSSLSLSHNQITNIASLINLSNLSFLDVQYNNIADISVFAYMNEPRIQVLNLSTNPVDDLTPLLDLNALAELMIYADPDVLNVSSGSDNMQIIRQLVDRAVSVYFTSVNYQAYVQDIGLQGLRFNGELAGDPDLIKPIQGFNANLVFEQMNESVGKVEYKADFRDFGWTYWTSGNMLGAPTDIIEGLAFRLTNFSALNYDIYYRVFVANFGWLDWASNGQPAGSYGYGYPIVALEVQLAAKGGIPPGEIAVPYLVNSDITYYTVHFDSQGGSLVNDVVTEANTKVIAPAPPIMDGHIFEGWYTDSSCQFAWDFNQDFVTADTTLYAKWSMNPDFTSGIAIYSYPSKMIYTYGEDLSLDGGSLMVSFGGGDTVIVPMISELVSIIGYDSSQIGTQILTVTYDGQSTQFNVEVLPLPNQSVTQINVSGLNGVSRVPVNGMLPMVAEVLPLYATTRAVAWSVKRGTGSAVISPTGVLTGTKAGTVTVTATATDGSGVKGSATIIVMVPVTDISVTGTDNATVIEVSKTLQMKASILPSTATYKSVTWSVIPGTGTATISSSGLLEGIAEGTVTVVAAATDDSGVEGRCEITIIPLQPSTLVDYIAVSSSSGATTLKIRASLQMIALVQPQSATNKAVTWSVTYGTGQAKITATGLLTGTRAGTVTVTATAVDGSGVQGSMVITITK